MTLRQRLLREPLLHFALLGVVIFAVDALHAAGRPEPRVISVDAVLRQDLSDAFAQRRGRAPTQDERERLVRDWLEDEVLFREGVALGLDRDDPLIRSHVVEKMRFMLTNVSNQDARPTEQQLRAWYAEHEADYLRSPSYSFSHAFVGESGDPARRQAELVRQRLAAGEALENVAARTRVFVDRSLDNVTAMFGPAFSQQLASAAAGTWWIAESSQGIHVVRLDGVRDATAPSFDVLRDTLEQDFRREQAKRAGRERLDGMRQRYEVQEGES